MISNKGPVATASQFTQVDQLADEFEAAFQAGQKPRIESFLEKSDSKHRAAALTELLKVEIELRRSRQEDVHLEDYIGRFAGLEAIVVSIWQSVDHTQQTSDFRTPIPPSHQAPTKVHKHSDSGSGRLEVRCPNCHQATEVEVDTSLTDLTCSSCGSHFSLVNQSATTRQAPPLSKLGRFELLERLGIGGFGSVWKARDKELDRTVAVKIPRAGMMTGEEQEKFFREARAAAQLRHPSIVSVHEVGRDGDSVYIVSDFVRGVTLGDWLTGQLPNNREAAELCAQIADALEHAHAQGVVHRDLKPANIMIDGEGRPHLMDFGLARREVGEVTVTMDGQILGTPAYMSPEQAKGEAHTADRRSDIYSMGVMLFQLLTGELPFRGNARMIMHQTLHDEAPSPRKLNANVKRDLETITLKCLEKDPAKRFQTAAEFAEELRRFLRGEPIHARPVSSFARGWRWMKRKPAIAGMSATILILLVGAISVLAVSNAAVRRESLEKAAALEKARINEARAEKNAKDAEEFAKQAKKNEEDAKANEKRANENAASAEKNLQKVQEIAVELDRKRADAEILTAKAIANEEIAHRRYYAAQLSLASHAWRVGQHAQTVSLLESLRPNENEKDFRGSEWRYLYHLSHANVIRRWHGHSVQVLKIVWPRDANYFISVSNGDAIRIWNGNSGELEGIMVTGGSIIDDLAASADGKLVAAAYRSGKVEVWDTFSRKKLAQWAATKSDRSLSAIAIHPTKQWIVTGLSGSIDEHSTRLICWDLRGNQIQKLDRVPQPIRRLEFSPNGKVLAATSGNSDGAMLLWNWGDVSKKIPHIDNIHASDIAFSSDSKTIWCSRSVKKANEPCLHKIELRVEKPTLAASFSGHENFVKGVACLSNNSRVVTASQDHTLRLWDASTGESSVVGAEPGDVYAIASSPEGNRVVCGDIRGGMTLRNLDLPGAIVEPELVKVSSDKPGIGDVAYSPDGKLLYVGCSPINLLNVENFETKETQPRDDSDAAIPQTISAISPDCTLAATYDRETGKFHVWNIKLNKLQAKLDAGKSTYASFSHDNRRIATWSKGKDDTMKIWDLSSGNFIEYKSGGGRVIQSVAFCPDSKHIAIAVRWDGLIVLDVEKNKSVYRTITALDKLADNPINSEMLPNHLVFSQDGSKLAAGFSTGEVILWNFDSLKGKLEFRSQLRNHTKMINWMTFSPDGRTFATASKDHTVRMWDIDLQQETITLDISAKRLDFSAQGDQLAILTTDNKLQVLKSAGMDSMPEFKNFKNSKNVSRDVKTYVEQGNFNKVFQLGKAGDEKIIEAILNLVRDPKYIESLQARGLHNVSNLTTLAYIHMIAGDARGAEASLRILLPFGTVFPDWYYSTLGWCQFAQGKSKESRRAFEKCLYECKRLDGTYDLGDAAAEHLVAAYFLDLISEQKYLERFTNVSYPWFFVGQRREIEGKTEAAAIAYGHCIDPASKPSPSIETFAKWRLLQLEKLRSESDRKKLADAITQQDRGLQHQFAREFSKAQECFKFALDIRKQILGEDHPDTAQSMSGVGFAMMNLDNFAAAQPLFERALAVKKKILGNKHPRTAESLWDLGTLHRLKREYAAARPYLEEALAVRKEIFGENNPQTVSTKIELGNLHLDMENYSEALPCFEQAFAAIEGTSDEKNVDAILILNSWAMILDKLGRMDEAAAVRQKFAKLKGN